MKKIFSLALSAMVIVLEALPFGAVLRFADPNPDQLTVKTFSYFDPTPYGYANFGPMLTAVLSVALLIALAVYFAKSKGLTAIRIISAIAIFTSILPLVMLGKLYFTFVGICITVLLILVFVSSFAVSKNEA